MRSAPDPKSASGGTPRRSRRSALIAGLAAVVIVVSVGILALGRRQSAVRLERHTLLLSVAQGAKAHAEAHGTSPTIGDLLTHGAIDPSVARYFSIASPVPGNSPLGLPLLVQSSPCRAVRKGEAWGGPGETIDRDLAACRYVLMPDWTVVPVDEPQFQRDIAPRVRLIPIMP